MQRLQGTTPVMQMLLYPREQATDFEALRARALGGWIKDQYCLAVAYENGLGTEQDYLQAQHWYRKVAESNGSDVAKQASQASLSDSPQRDRLIAEQGRRRADKRIQDLLDDPVARRKHLGRSQIGESPVIYWYEMAAEQGDVEAQCSMVMLYEQLSSKDYEKAFFWCKKAALKGDGFAQATLARYLNFGHGCSINYPQAEIWYRAAAEQGELEGQIFMGQLLSEKGQLIAARHWLRKAAEQGDCDSQCKLAGMYAEGLGGPVDLVEAYAWYLTWDATGGFDYYHDRIDDLADRLTSEQLANAQSLAQRYIKGFWG